jgi:uncharacterized protein (DUF433 family)
MFERATQPRYSFAEASRLIGRRAGTLRRWSLGNDRVYRGAHRHDPPLIRIDGLTGEDEPPLSFLNLIELRFLASWRERGMTLPYIRDALAYSAEQLGAARPLLDLDFKLQGKELFVRYGSQMLNPARKGQLQLAWPDAADALFESLDYEEEAVFRWWPLGRQEPITVDTRINGGRPTTVTTGVRTVAIATRVREGWSRSEIQEDTAANSAEIAAAARVEGVALAA